MLTKVLNGTEAKNSVDMIFFSPDTELIITLSWENKASFLTTVRLFNKTKASVDW